LILRQTIARQKNDTLFLTDLQTPTKNDPGSRYGSTGDPGSVLVPGQAKITKSERHLAYISRNHSEITWWSSRFPKYI